MKSKLKMGSSAAGTLALVAVLTMVIVVNAGAAGKRTLADPVADVPVPPAADPAEAPWKDANWKDPDKVMSDVSLDGLPLSEVVQFLRNEFKDAFDVLMPNGWQDAQDQSRSIDPVTTFIKMHLHNVTASEIFNAMNLAFEIQNTPLRWELKMNGNRPTAVLHVLPALVPFPMREPPQEPVRRTIYFVGDLVRDDDSGGVMTMEKLVKVVSEVYQMSFNPVSGFGGGARASNVHQRSDEQAQRAASRILQFHKETQLLIVTGTPDQIAFVQQTLSALRTKAEMDRSKAKPKTAEPKVKTEPAKTP